MRLLFAPFPRFARVTVYRYVRLTVLHRITPAFGTQDTRAKAPVFLVGEGTLYVGSLTLADTLPVSVGNGALYVGSLTRFASFPPGSWRGYVVRQH